MTDSSPFTPLIIAIVVTIILAVIFYYYCQMTFLASLAMAVVIGLIIGILAFWWYKDGFSDHDCDYEGVMFGYGIYGFIGVLILGIFTLFYAPYAKRQTQQWTWK